MANRRFVPFYFDLSPRGAAGDADARDFVVKVKKVLAGAGVPAPPVLFLSSKGELLGEVQPYCTPDELLAGMLKVLKDHPRYDRPLPNESDAGTVVERAEILIDLQKLSEARKLLEAEDGESAHYLLGRLARFRRDWAAQSEHLKWVADPKRQDDIRMELASPLWFSGKYEELTKHLLDFPKDSRRNTEARYHEGLARFHVGNTERALAIWKSTIRGRNQATWIY